MGAGDAVDATGDAADATGGAPDTAILAPPRKLCSLRQLSHATRTGRPSPSTAITVCMRSNLQARQ